MPSADARQAQSAITQAPAAPVDAKGVALVTTSPNVWTADASWGWSNKYYFRGLDVLEVVSPDDGGGVSATRLNIAYSRPNDAFLLGLGYVQALKPQQAAGAAARGFAREDEFNIKPDSRYAETNLYLAYSRSLVPDKLMGTVGYNRYNFSDPDYWLGVGSSNEAFVRFDFLDLPIVHPSITYVNEFEGFEGSYLEAKIEADFDLFTIGSTRVSLQPYMALSYDMEYNGTDQGWNALEYGVNIPFRITDSVTVSLNANYTQGLDSTIDDLGAGPVSVPRVDPGFWGGIVVSGTWGSYSEPATSEQGSGKSGKGIYLPVEDQKWEVSTGAGWRTVSSTFEHAPVAQSAVASGRLNALLGQSKTSGDLALVTPGGTANYDNGSVGPDLGGTAPFTGGDGRGTTGNRQVVFTTERFNHVVESSTFSSAIRDDDSVMFPYLQVDRELWRSGSLSVRTGLLYSYTGAETDSGYTAARTDIAFKETSVHGFVYDVAEAISGPGFGPGVFLVTDGALYFGNSAFGPQTTQLDTRESVAQFGAFVSSRLNLSAHDLAAPIDVRYDFGERLHFEASIAPTVTFANSSLDSLLEVRRLNDRTRTIDDSGNSYSIRQQVGFGAGFGGVLVGGGVGAAEQRGTNATRQAPNGISASGIDGTGGKNGGRFVPYPQKPGTLLDSQRFSESQSEALLGFTAGAKLVLDLNEEGTWFLDVWGRYQHVDDLSLSNGLGSTDIDLSGWQLGSGIGIRF